MKKGKANFNVKDIMAPNAPAGPSPAAPPSAPPKRGKKKSGGDTIGQPTPVQKPLPMMGGMGIPSTGGAY
jgi:hypothetical protein